LSWDAASQLSTFEEWRKQDQANHYPKNPEDASVSGVKHSNLFIRDRIQVEQ